MLGTSHVSPSWSARLRPEGSPRVSRFRQSIPAISMLCAALVLTACADGTFASKKLPRINAARYEAATFFGGGDYVAIQDFTAEGTPTVSVRDLNANTTRTAKGYVLLRAEPHSPVLWLEPAKIHDVAEAIANKEHIDGSRYLAGPFAHGFPYDSPPAELAVWDVRDPDGEPSSIAASRWQRWPGQTDTAFLEVDPLKGSAPSAVLFMPNRGRSDGVKAKLPDGVDTILPLGWSPDGKVFAVETLVRQREVARRKRRVARGLPERKLLVFDPADASIAAESTIDSTTASPAAWTADGKITWASVARSGQDTSTPAVWVFDPKVRTKTELEVPRSWKGRQPLLLGSDASGTVFAVPAAEARGDVIWRIFGDRFARLGSVRDYSYDYSAPDGVLALSYTASRPSEGIAAWNLVPTAKLGNPPIFTGPVRPVRSDEK